jgi:hypothetical protein
MAGAGPPGGAAASGPGWPAGGVSGALAAATPAVVFALRVISVIPLLAIPGAISGRYFLLPDSTIPLRARGGKRSGCLSRLPERLNSVAGETLAEI